MEERRRTSSTRMALLRLIYLLGQLYQHLSQVRSLTVDQNVFAQYVIGGNAVISLVFAEYLNRLMWHTTSASSSPDDIPQWAIKLTASLAVLVVSAMCVATPTLGTRAAVVFTSVKVNIYCHRIRTLC